MRLLYYYFCTVVIAVGLMTSFLCSLYGKSFLPRIQLVKANPEHLEKFGLGAEAFNAWRKANCNVPVNLFGIKVLSDFSPVTRSDDNQDERDFTYINLDGANLRRSVLFSTSFSHGSFKNADLTAVQCFRSIFTSSDCSDILLKDARIPFADFTGAIMRRAILYASNCVNTKFVGADLTGANFTLSYLLGNEFSQATMKFCRLDNANIAYADEENAAFDDADLTGSYAAGTYVGLASFKNTKLVETTFLKGTFNKVKFLGTLANKANFSGTFFINSIIQNADFSETNLSKTFFIDTSFKDANFSGANFSGARFSVNDGQSDFSGTTISGADFSDASLKAVTNLGVSSVTGKLSVKLTRGAFYNANTQFPKGFNPKVALMIEKS